MDRFSLVFAMSDCFDTVLMIQKNRPEWQAGKLNGIGGKVEDGETYFGCAIREFREEAGLNISAWGFIPFCDMIFPKDIAVKGAATVRCFAVKMPLPRLLEYKRDLTDEPIKRISMVHPFPENLIPSCNWLIWMAKESLIRPYDFRSIEVVSIAEMISN